MCAPVFVTCGIQQLSGLPVTIDWCKSSALAEASCFCLLLSLYRVFLVNGLPYTVASYRVYFTD